MNKIVKWVFLVPLLVFSCNTVSIIPEKDMVSILVKISLTDAMVVHTDLRGKYFDKDTIDYYGKTIRDFGYSYKQFDSSLKYYSANPKQLDAIYDKVVFELSKIQTDIDQKEEKEALLRDSTENIWNLNTSYELNLDSPQNFISFSIPVTGLGSYTLSYEVQIFPDDETIEPQLKYFFYYDNKTDNGDVSQYTTVPYLKDGSKQLITKQLDLQNKLVTHIKGVILDFNNPNTKFRNHAIVSNIKLLFKRDSIAISKDKLDEKWKKRVVKKVK